MVRVTDKECFFITYGRWFIDNKIGTENIIKYAYGNEPNENQLRDYFTVLEKAVDKHTKETLYLITPYDNDQTFLISERGIEKIGGVI